MDRQTIWEQLIAKKDDFIGGTLEDFGDDEGDVPFETTIIDMRFEDNSFFRICGEKFDCGFATQYGGIIGGSDGWTEFAGYGGHRFRIKKEARD